MFTKICVALDRLSNANFTPSAAIKSLSVVSTAPALSMEEALPISVSTETQQTPEEVYKRETKVLKGESEKTQDERNSERRVGRGVCGLKDRPRRLASTPRRCAMRMNFGSVLCTMRALDGFLKPAR